jgi:hypothetical protein
MLDDPDAGEAFRVRARRLIAMANELLLIAEEIELGDALPGQQQGTDFADFPRLHSVAHHIYRQRRRRSEIFPSELFGEPAWDILLDLFVAAKRGEKVSVTSACIGATVPSTTALRWITLLEDERLLVREKDESDARRVFVRLTAGGYRKMVEYLGKMLGPFPYETIRKESHLAGSASPSSANGA